MVITGWTYNVQPVAVLGEISYSMPALPGEAFSIYLR